MEFNNQYLTYEEYQELGGTLDETPFNIAELKARKKIDRSTFGRLQDLEEQSVEVKTCMYELINIEESYSNYKTRDKSIAGESTDGYSVSYSSANGDTTKSQKDEEKEVIQTTLAECRLEDGTPYLYCGGGKIVDEYRFDYIP